jgi:hypothetical protein
MHRLRTVPAGLPGGLHRDAAGHRRPPAGRPGAPARPHAARERYAFHRCACDREARENDARLAAKAEAKLADLAAHSQHATPRCSTASAR